VPEPDGVCAGNSELVTKLDRLLVGDSCSIIDVWDGSKTIFCSSGLESFVSWVVVGRSGDSWSLNAV